MLNFCDFIQVYVFITNHHLKRLHYKRTSESKVSHLSDFPLQYEYMWG